VLSFCTFKWRAAGCRDEQAAWSKLLSFHSHAVHFILAGREDWLSGSAVRDDVEGLLSLLDHHLW
jgi:hypothetical protein